MKRRGLSAIALWLAFLLTCGIIISRTQFTADLSAFLPRTPTAEQQLLMDQLRDGIASRLILVGLEGADPATRADLSKKMAATLRTDPEFATVNNGEPVTSERDQAFLLNNRYLLSPSITPARFTEEGLHAALSDSIETLASPAGLLMKSLLPRDPTGEMLQLLEQFNSSKQPRLFNGAWASKDGTKALMLLQTRASGSDTDAQQQAMLAIQHAYDKASGASAGAKLLMTGPGIFSVTSRETIKSEVARLSLISIAMIATLLLLVYRSVTALALGYLPVISGVLGGIAAVSIGFGSVHGITLGFGTALIGEAIDYSIYLFVQSEQNGRDQEHWVKQFWPTIRLGVLTSIFGFASLLLSGFPGLAQLGLYSIAGLIVAALVTRFVLPHLLPRQFRIHDVSALGRGLGKLVQRASALRWPAALLLLGACAVLATHWHSLLNSNISSLSPVPQADVELDGRLRADMGAPDVRYLIVAGGKTRDAALQSAEQVSSVLQREVDQGALGSFESPSRYLPSLETQRARQASLPSTAQLEPRLTNAVQDLPVRASLFAPFLADVAAAQSRSLLQPSDLVGTSMAMAVDALLIEKNQHWTALLPLTAPVGIEINAEKIRADVTATMQADVMLIDMKAESDRIYSGYLNEVVMLSAGGLVGIVALLLLVFRSPVRVFRLVAPLAASVVTVTAGLTLLGQQLVILHLVGLLLVVAIGSNYALFFDRPKGSGAVSPRTLASMLFANLTTVAGFGLLAFSSVSILQAMGSTVAPGVILALIFAAIFAQQPDSESNHV